MLSRKKKYSKHAFFAQLLLMGSFLFLQTSASQADTKLCTCYQDASKGSAKYSDGVQTDTEDKCRNICLKIVVKGTYTFGDYTYKDVTTGQVPDYSKSTNITSGAAANSSQNSNSSSNANTPNSGAFDYKLLESFPGFFSAGQSVDFPTLILSIYKFGIWTIGIAALLMLVIGGAMYMTSAGNTSSAGSAKGVIKDALIGVAAAMMSWLILYVINPDLTKIDLSHFGAVNVDQFTIPVAPSSPGNCDQPITDPNNPCSISKLRFFIANQGDPNIDPDKWASQASYICRAESGGKADIGSSGKCGGTSIAWGLFQINLNAHCNGAFSGKWSSKYGYQDGGCTVSNQATFESCRQNAINPTWNLQQAWNMYKKRGSGYDWGDWEANSKWCHFAPKSANK
ncbi:MAG TPA: pilin [Patescibacteria group bacterium]